MGQREETAPRPFQVVPADIQGLYEELGTWRRVGEALGGYSHAYVIALARGRVPITNRVYNAYVHYRQSRWPLKPTHTTVALASFELPGQVLILTPPRRCPECEAEAREGFRDEITIWFVPRTHNQIFCTAAHRKEWRIRQRLLERGQDTLWPKVDLR